VIKLRAQQNRCAAEGLLDHGLLILASHTIGHGRFQNLGKRSSSTYNRLPPATALSQEAGQ
jgi:hypothetical protein